MGNNPFSNISIDIVIHTVNLERSIHINTGFNSRLTASACIRTQRKHPTKGAIFIYPKTNRETNWDQLGPTSFTNEQPGASVTNGSSRPLRRPGRHMALPIQSNPIQSSPVQSNSVQSRPCRTQSRKTRCCQSLKLLDRASRPEFNLPRARWLDEIAFR
jgi:hypothetical protein